MKKLTGHLYFWVLIAILIGGTFGFLNPAAAVKLKPLWDTTTYNSFQSIIHRNNISAFLS